MTNTAFLIKLGKRLEENRDYAKEKLAAFATELQSSPIHALAWADKQFNFAAHIGIANDVLPMLEAGEDIDHISSVLGTSILRAARFRARSTSPCTNLMAEEELRVMAETLEWIENNRPK